jgi:hypothetical protein
MKISKKIPLPSLVFKHSIYILYYPIRRQGDLAYSYATADAHGAKGCDQ